MSSIDRFARRQRVQERTLKDSTVLPRLPYSSIDGGALRITDQVTGDVVGIFGQQFDGTVTAASVGGTPPPSPTVPFVTPILGGLTIYWDGTFVDGLPTRMDFRRVTFHAVIDIDDLDVLTPAQLIGEVTTATGGEVTVSLPPVEHFIVAVAWTDAGKFSAESDVAFGTPATIADEPAFEAALGEIIDIQTELVSVPLTFRQTTQPTGLEGRKAIWYDTDAPGGDAPWFYNGSSWSQIEFGPTALAASAVIAETIATGALDGKMITGPLIQTLADSDLGIKLINNTLIAFDDGGDVVFLLDGDTGDVAFSGALFAGGNITGADITGATVTGGVVRTASSGERIEMNTDTMSASTVKFFSGALSESTPNTIMADDFWRSNPNCPTIKVTGGRRSGTTAALPTVELTTTSVGSMVNIEAQDVLALGVTGTKRAELNLRTTGTSHSAELSAYVNGSTAASIAAQSPGFIGVTGAMRGPTSTSPVSISTSLQQQGGGAVKMQGGIEFVGNYPRTPFTPGGGWNNLGGNNDTCAYAMVNGVVYLEGLITTGATGAIIGNLPAALRPAKDKHFAVAASNNVVSSVALRASDGAIIVFGTGAGGNYMSIALSFLPKNPGT